MIKLGEKYRELRKEQGVTLSNAAQNICSVSNLSRWETGKIELDFQIVVELLNRIHIETEEFLGYTKFIVTDHIPEDVMKAYDTENTDEMKILIDKYTNQYHHDKNIYNLYLSLILANQYQIIKKKNLLSLKDQIHIFNYLSKTTLWSYFNLSFFGNSVFLIDSKKIFAIGMIIIDNFNFKDDEGDISGLITALGTLGDATIALILEKDINHAKNLLTALKKISIPKYLDFFNLVFSFLEKIIHYTQNKDEQAILLFIDQVVQLNMLSSANIFLEVFKKIKAAEN